MNAYRFEGKFVRELESDHAAFEEACGWYDDRDASIEKWIDNQWCAHSDPLYHPVIYRLHENGGWMLLNKHGKALTVIPADY